MDPYEKLLGKTKELYQLQTGMGIVRWDLQTHMPPKGMKQRSEQLALLSKLWHRMATDKEIGQIVTTLQKDRKSLNFVQKREVELVSRRLTRISKVPEELVAQESIQRTVTTATWKRAKDTNNWKLFESELVTLLDISKSIAEIIMKETDAESLFDALMDYWEPRMTSKSLTAVFRDLRKRLIPRVKKYSSLCEDVRVDFKKREVPVNVQRKLVTNVAGVVGYDTTSESAGGRIDESEHPFTTGYYDDVRFTIRYSIDDVFRAVFGGLHETGHAIHSQNQNPDWKWMMLGRSCSSGFSESQSRFIENVIGRSPEFWKFYFPKFQEITEGIFKDISYQDLLRAINIVRPSTIRVLADEMTYGLHIILRYEIEQALFDEKMDVSEIPHVWNDKFEEYLGIEPQSDTDGALQDVQWAWAMWGYFPNYVLGNLYAAMMREKMCSDIPEWLSQVAEGNVTIPVQWLIDNVHRKSNLYDPAEMIKNITGKSLTVDPFIKYLDEKYSA
ncbi:MAG: carboxypeptidase M32, partial [Candidatus Thorarchaeota archaeon]